MEKKDPKKARWSVLLFAFVLSVCSIGLVGCPEEDDDDDDVFEKVSTVTVVQDQAVKEA